MREKEENTTQKRKKNKNKKTESKLQAKGRTLKIKLVRSLIGRPRKQREVVKGLGLRKVNSEVVRKNSPEIWGMINKVHHLVKVEVMDKK